MKKIDTTTIGHSVHGKAIYAYHVGDYGENQIIVTGAIHAREWITALLILELVEIYRKEKFNGGVYFVPLCNPDGVEIALTREPLWKANARGVDLNVNFDADWGGGVQNVREPGSENYIGPHPASEPEVQALIDFTRAVKPKATIAYHSKGEEIYYNGLRDCERTKQLAYAVAESTGYKPIKPRGSTGGYSDWVSLHLGVPALTIEVGNDNYAHPIGVDKLDEILAQNKDVIRVLFSTLFDEPERNATGNSQSRDTSDNADNQAKV